MAFAKPHVIGRAFIAKAGRYGIVNLEMIRIAECNAQLFLRVGPFLRPVKHGDEVCRG